METTSLLQCPCGVPVRSDLPAPGARPEPCGSCGTPLVRPGRIDGAALERGLAGAIVAAAVCAAGWMAVVRSSGDPSPVVVAAAGLVIGLAAATAARARGTGIQVAAGVGVLVFLVLGEFLIYRQALEPWLLRLHEAEGADDAFFRAKEEFDDMDFGRFIHLTSTLPIFVGLACAFAGAFAVTSAPRAVAAFEVPPRPRPAAPVRAPEVDTPDMDAAGADISVPAEEVP